MKTGKNFVIYTLLIFAIFTSSGCRHSDEKELLQIEYINFDNVLSEYYDHVSVEPTYVMNKDKSYIFGYFINAILPANEDGSYFEMAIYGYENKEIYTTAYLDRFDYYEADIEEVNINGTRLLLKSIGGNDSLETIGYFEKNDGFYYLSFVNNGLSQEEYMKLLEISLDKMN